MMWGKGFAQEKGLAVVVENSMLGLSDLLQHKCNPVEIHAAAAVIDILGCYLVSKNAQRQGNVSML